jgi:hypothetical protein
VGDYTVVVVEPVIRRVPAVSVAVTVTVPVVPGNRNAETVNGPALTRLAPAPTVLPPCVTVTETNPANGAREETESPERPGAGPGPSLTFRFS